MSRPRQRETGDDCVVFHLSSATMLYISFRLWNDTSSSVERKGFVRVLNHHGLVKRKLKIDVCAEDRE
jgi:hypothetical protein